MGHYDICCVLIRMSGIFGKNTKGIKQTTINSELKKIFNYDFLNEFENDKDYDKTMDSRNTKEHESNTVYPDCQTAKELHAFLTGNYVGCGCKGDCFSFSHVGNYRHLVIMQNGWKLITSKMPDSIPPIFLLSMCEDGGLETSVVHNGKVLETNNIWDSYGLFDRFV